MTKSHKPSVLNNAERKALFSALNDRERHIFEARRLFSKEPVTLKTLGEQYGISRERVRQIEDIAAKKIKAATTVYPPGVVRLPRTVEWWAMQIQRRSASLPLASQNVIEAGRKAWKRIKSSSRQRQNYHDWQQVSEALAVGENLAMDLAGKTDQGGAYARLIGAWLRLNKMADIAPAVRAWCREVRRNQAEIDTWRNALPLERRVKMNHPRTLLDHWKKAPKQPKQSSAAFIPKQSNTD
jgi:hypothetical protein